METVVSTKDAPERVRAYQRGWNEAQAWMVPHLNPYVTFSDAWRAWEQGYEEGRAGGNGKVLRTQEV